VLARGSFFILFHVLYLRMKCCSMIDGIAEGVFEVK